MEIRVIEKKDIDLRDINLVTLVGVAEKVTKWNEVDTGHQSIKFNLKVRDYKKVKEDWNERTSFIKILLMDETAKTYWDQVTEGARVSVIGKIVQNEMKGEDGYRTDWTTIEAKSVKNIGERKVKPVEAINKMNQTIQESIKEWWSKKEEDTIDLKGSEYTQDFTKEEIDWIVKDGPANESIENIDMYEIKEETIEDILGPESEKDPMDVFR